MPCPMGSYCTGDGTKTHCPAGTIGSVEGLSTMMCNGACPEGYYCPIGSAEGVVCGSGQGQYCPKGSSVPLIAAVGFYTIPNHQENSLGIRGGTEMQSSSKVCEGDFS